MTENGRASSSTRPAREQDHELRSSRLGSFLRWMLPIAIGFDVVYLVAGIVLHSGALLGGAADVLLFVIALVIARRRLDRNEPARAAELVALGLFVMCMVGAPLLPWLRAGLVLIPLAGVALVLPDLEGQRLRRLLILAFFAEASTVVLSTLVHPLFTPPPESLRSIVIVCACSISVALTVLLLWEDANRLRRSIASADFHALKMQAVVARAPIVVFALDREGKYTLSEGKGLTSFGLEPGQIVGRSAFSLYAEVAWLRDAIARALAGEEVSVSGDYGDKFIEVHLRPLEDGGAIGVSVDVTARRRAEEDLERAVRVRDEFLSVASHELKTPLTALQLEIASIERASERGDLGRIRARSEKLGGHASRLNALVDQLLDVGRMREGRLALAKADLDLGELVRTVVARMETAIERAGCRIDLRVEGDSSGHWDGSRLDQVATNLLTNALKYAPREPVQIEVVGLATEVRLTVRDHGMGIAPADQARIFGRFERAVSDRNYGGLGLGLFIVHELVTAHGGEVSVESTIGEGATFTVLLPRSQSVSAQQRKPVE